jgi:hypothetical protein
VCISTANPIADALNEEGITGVPPATLCVIPDIGCAIIYREIGIR